ncbi:unnamed protein product [Adineta ricciae]|uniref:Uncharacterized protein n=1 Tax=Adineta ricciae TaxID=249248 RepID=A0A813SNB0_ADIRI|nr:unnamed protein product [Adineta ricciae]
MQRKISMIATTAFGNNLRLYDSFAEIHQVYNGPLRFQQAEWDNIKHESLILRSFSNDTNQTNTFERRILRLNANSSDKRIFVRTHLAQEEPIACELIRDDREHSLVRDIKTGRYFHVHSDLIEYSYEPQSNPIYQVSFHPILTNHSLVVTFILNSLRWNARYTLQTYNNGQVEFQVLADIINTSPLPYYSNRTYLMSGDINLAFGSGKSSALTISSDTLESTVDYSGVHLFSTINKTLTIEPYSILTLPILFPYIRVKALFVYTLILTMPSPILNSAQAIISGKHKFQRLYQLSNSSSFLPTGHLLLYDSSAHILTGEWQLPTLAESEKYEFELGQDADIMLVYNRTLSMNRATNSSLMTTNVLIQNYKQRKVNIRFKSICQVSITCLFYDNKARSLGSRLRSDLVIDAKSEIAFTFTTIRLN